MTRLLDRAHAADEPVGSMHIQLCSLYAQSHSDESHVHAMCLLDCFSLSHVHAKSPCSALHCIAVAHTRPIM